MKYLICGGPSTGKTTAADAFGKSAGIPVLHTDDLIGKMDWSAASEEVAKWMERDGPWIIEGVAAFRALRKWLSKNSAASMRDVTIIYLQKPFKPLTSGQESMMKGIATVWAGIVEDVSFRGAKVSNDFPAVAA